MRRDLPKHLIIFHARVDYTARGGSYEVSPIYAADWWKNPHKSADLPGHTFLLLQNVTILRPVAALSGRE